MAGHEHEHDHAHDDHDHDHTHGEDEAPDASAWIASSQKTVCPECGASGALTLGGGIFCPACGEVSTNAGYAPPESEPT